MDFSVPLDHIVKIKEKEKRDLTKALRKLWNIKVTVGPIIIGALGTIHKGSISGLEE